MPDSLGNLALKRKRSGTTGRSYPRLQVHRHDFKPHRIPVSATPDSWQIEIMRARAIHRQLAHRRLRLLSMLIILVLSVSGLFALIVYRQAMILEENFENVAIAREIDQMNQESSQIRESLAQNTNLDEIRHAASSRLGLQDPARSQVVSVVVPKTDSVIFSQPGTPGTQDEAYLASVFSTIEGFFKTMTVKNQGD